MALSLVTPALPVTPSSKISFRDQDLAGVRHRLSGQGVCTPKEVPLPVSTPALGCPFPRLSSLPPALHSTSSGEVLGWVWKPGRKEKAQSPKEQDNLKGSRNFLKQC